MDVPLFDAQGIFRYSSGLLCADLTISLRAQF